MSIEEFMKTTFDKYCLINNVKNNKTNFNKYFKVDKNNEKVKENV